MSDRGSITILAATMAAVTLAAALVAFDVHRLLVARAVAQSAADAAALAAAPLTFAAFGSERPPEDEAALFAGANGAELVECICDPDPVWRARVVVVTVSVAVESLLGFDRVTARAAAEFDPTVWLTG